MKTINIIILLFAINCTAQSNDLNIIRKSYLESFHSEKNINKLINTCDINKNNSVISAYKTVAELMLIKYKYNPINKFKLFNEHTKNLDLIVSNNLNNIEIRFLRYCIQKQTPIFLGYDDNLELDYKFIIKNIELQTIELQEYINSTLETL